MLLLGILVSLLILYVHVLAFRICEWCRFADLDFNIKNRNEKFEEGLNILKETEGYRKLEDND